MDWIVLSTSDYDFQKAEQCRRGNRHPIDLSGGALLDWGVTTRPRRTDRQHPTGQSLRRLGLRDPALPVTTDLTHFTLDPAALYAQRDRIARQISQGSGLMRR